MSPSTETRENRAFAAEIKFGLTPAVADQIRDWTNGRLAPDPNAFGSDEGSYRITSLYFDTEHFDVFHRHGSYGRSKFRVRRYGRSDLVFLERKLKTRGWLTKRRSCVGLTDLTRLTDAEQNGPWTGRWFHRRLLARRLRSVAQISYRRVARVALTPNGPIRLTLDYDLTAVRAAGLEFQDNGIGTPFLENHVILELKYLREMPVLFKMLIGEFSLCPQSVSKYRIAAAALGLAKPPEMEVSNPSRQQSPLSVECRKS